MYPFLVLTRALSPQPSTILCSHECAGFAGRPGRVLITQSVHNWLSTPPLPVAASTNIRTSLQVHHWLPERPSRKHLIA